MTLTLAIALIPVLVVVIALAVMRTRRRAPDVVPVARPIVPVEVVATAPPMIEPPKADPAKPAEDQPKLEARPEPQPEPEPQQEPEPEPEPQIAITWTAALTPAALDEAARLRVIDDLALLAAPWSIALLRRAYEEETSLLVCSRIESALASSGEPITTTH